MAFRYSPRWKKSICFIGLSKFNPRWNNEIEIWSKGWSHGVLDNESWNFAQSSNCWNYCWFFKLKIQNPNVHISHPYSKVRIITFFLIVCRILISFWQFLLLFLTVKSLKPIIYINASGWKKHFSFNKTDSLAKCMHCSALLKASGSLGTKSLHNHLKAQHLIKVQKLHQSRESAISIPTKAVWPHALRKYKLL